MSYTLPQFLAHAIALESEAADRYHELADMMEAHRNDEVSALFRDMVRYSRLHHDSVVARAGGTALPKIGPWEYLWRTPPEAGGDEAFDYRIHPYDALLYARENEVRAMNYYAEVERDASLPEVRHLAAQFAAEEAEHVAALDQWLARTQRP
ncbi:MAG: ferritin family protein [Burkholderiaceae bacterium]|nr:ferritin family protein [Burkholderiaceae bacterium]